MIQLFDAEQGGQIGTITEAQLQTLIDLLEEESSVDQDYYLNAETVDMLEQNGAEAALVALLRQALSGREGIEIRWARA
jgi:hypothetical protein